MKRLYLLATVVLEVDTSGEDAREWAVVKAHPETARLSPQTLPASGAVEQKLANLATQAVQQTYVASEELDQAVREQIARDRVRTEGDEDNG